MARGVAGYGRYDDDPGCVACPWAKSDMTPCIARDGRLALAGDPPTYCLGCGQYLSELWHDLAGVHDPADRMLSARPHDPMDDAQAFRAMVWSATAPQGEVDDA